MAVQRENQPVEGLASLATQTPYEPTQIAKQESSFVPRELTETGKGETYTGKTEEDILGASQKGLVSMLDQDNPLMQLARKQGARLAASRGLGGSSLRERAAQGAAIESAMPLVQQAGQIASSERQSAQQATASSEIAASNRRLSEMQQQYELEVQSGDNAAARELQAAISQEQNNLAQWQTTSQIASSERQAQSEIAFRKEQAIKDQSHQLAMQQVDIGYKQWLEDVTFKHQGILQGNAQAANAYSDFTLASTNILNNPETSTEQKEASVSALKEALSSSLDVISSTADIDLSKFLPTTLRQPTQTTTPVVQAPAPATTVPTATPTTGDRGSSGSGQGGA